MIMKMKNIVEITRIILCCFNLYYNVNCVNYTFCIADSKRLSTISKYKIVLIILFLPSQIMQMKAFSWKNNYDANVSTLK